MFDRRLTLRTWMAVIVALGALFTWIRSQGSLYQALAVASHSIIAWGLSFFAAFALARWFGLAARTSGVRTTVSILRALSLAAALYLAWGHMRAWFFIYGLDHGLPYPDRAINALERWFDARRPVPPGSVKLHSEYLTVAFILGLLVVLLAGGAGLLSGLLANRPDGPVREPTDRLEDRSPAQ
jgi:hypothetical protein